MYILTLKHTKNYKQQNNSCECKKKRFTIFYKTSVHTYTFASTNFDDFNCLCTSVNIHFSSLTMDMLRLCNVNLSLKKRRIFYWQSIVYYYFRKCYYWFFFGLKKTGMDWWKYSFDYYLLFNMAQWFVHRYVKGIFSR